MSPDEAEQVVRNDPFELEEEIRGGERRYQFLGETDEGRILIVVAAAAENAVRVVTAWPAKRRLRAFWLTQKKGKRYGEEAE